MPFTRQRLRLDPASSRFLTSEFESISYASRSSLAARSGRVAVTFRPRRKGRDALPAWPVPIEEILLLALSYRSCQRPGRRPGWKVILGVHALALDFPGSGRVVFRCEQELDITAPGRLIRPRPNDTAMRSAVVLDQAIRDVEDVDLCGALRLPGFSFGFAEGSLPRFEPCVRGVAEAAEGRIDGLRACPAELFGPGGISRLYRRPDRVFASAGSLRGRRVRQLQGPSAGNSSVRGIRIGFVSVVPERNGPDPEWANAWTSSVPKRSHS